jgi:Homeodomain-like domain
MHPEDAIDEAIRLSLAGIPATQIARRIGVPRSTVRDWIGGHIPRIGRDGRPGRCGGFELRPEALPPSYVYLLGLYLGDGCLSAHPRGVFRLRVTLDRRYPGIVEECARAIAEVRPKSRVNRLQRPDNSVEVSSYWKAWPVLFPQHGSGPKHLRDVSLEHWQEQLVARSPELLLRGLIHSDGCRFINTGRGGWRHLRYSFSNVSEDIRDTFCSACDLLGLHWTRAPRTVYVSRKADVSRLDEFVGPKA